MGDIRLLSGGARAGLAELTIQRTLLRAPAPFLQIFYVSTNGEACLKFDYIQLRPFGMDLSITHKGKVKELLRN